MADLETKASNVAAEGSNTQATDNTTVVHIDQSAREEKSFHLTVLYSGRHNVKDVTRLALEHFVSGDDNVMRIPAGDVPRAVVFGDPSFGFLKHIRVIRDGTCRVYPHDHACIMDVAGAIPHPVLPCGEESMDPERALAGIHSKIQFQAGSMLDEYPEQTMSVMFVAPQSKVLEIGSNVGRNTMVLASLLANQENLVTLECDPLSYGHLLTNRTTNLASFRAENCALSYRRLFLQGWTSIPSNHPLDGFTEVKTATFEALEAKHNITFDTIVADCEGALFYILQDRPSILDKINLVLVENDYFDWDHKAFVDRLMIEKGLTCVFSMEGPWGPCAPFFYEAWKRL